MTNKKALVKTTPKDAKLALSAKALDGQIREAAKEAMNAFGNLCKLLGKMRTDGLWLHLVDGKGHPLWDRFEDYAQSILGPMARGKFYEMLAASSLTQGPNALPEAVVNEMGPKKAYQISRLEPEHRTVDSPIVQTARNRNSTVAEVTRKVQTQLNETLPADEQVLPTQMWARNLPLHLIQEYEELEAVAFFIPAIRDGDRTLSLGAKVFQLAVIGLREYHAGALAEAAELKTAYEAANDQKAQLAQAQGPEDEEDDDDQEHAVPEPEDIAAGVQARAR